MKKLLLILLCLVVILFSCTTTKSVQKNSTSTDLTNVQELRDSIHMLESEVETLSQTINESEYVSAEFDSTKCPDIRLPGCPAMLNKDSVNQLIADLNNAISGMRNQVKISADGSVEANGRLKSVKYQKDKQEQTISELQRTIDSLKSVQQISTVSVKTNTSSEHMELKRKLLTNWWLYLLAFVLGWLSCMQFRKSLPNISTITNLFKKKH